MIYLDNMYIKAFSEAQLYKQQMLWGTFLYLEEGIFPIGQDMVDSDNHIVYLDIRQTGILRAILLRGLGRPNFLKMQDYSHPASI